jgi:hypothetical protein
MALLPNTNYWLVLGETPGSNVGFSWGVTTNLSGSGAGFQVTSATTTNSGGTWTTRGDAPFQMRITANTVPEPSTLACLALGALVFATSLKLRRPV